MPSTIGWLDQSEEQQRRMREVIALFAESGTVDDIGIGVVRDAFSDLLFPGISTVQTRLRYFLFVPWVYQRLEAERVSSESAEKKAREWELQLIRSLKASGDTDGVIGRDAGDGLKQLPSFIYWNGLRFARVRQFAGTRADYHRAMNRLNTDSRRTVRGESDDDTVMREPARWHHHLPPAPDDLFEQATLALTAEEANYLQDRFVQADGDSLFSTLVRRAQPIDEALPYPWDAVSGDELSPVTALRVRHARWFSEVIHGAQLLYNLMLAEAAAERGLANGDERLERYERQLGEWNELIDARRLFIEDTDQREFWQLVFSSGARVSMPARSFISSWVELVVGRVDVANSPEARGLIRARERQQKKGMARLQNPRALENWGGAAGANRLDYRWGQGRSGVNDIAAALAGGIDV